MTLSGDLSAFHPADLLRRAAAQRLDAVLVVFAARAYRLRFVEGRLAGGCVGPPGADFRDYLVRSGALNEIEASEVFDAAVAADRPFLEYLLDKNAAFRDLFSQHLGELCEGVLTETGGRFFFGQPIRQLPPALQIDVDLDSLIAGSRAAARLPIADAEVELVASPASDDAAQQRVAKLLAAPRRLGDLLSSLGGKGDDVETTLSHMIRSGALRTRADLSPREGSAELSAGLVHIAREPTPDEVIFLTLEESTLLQEIAEQPQVCDVNALRRASTVDATVLPAIVRAFVDAGLLQPTRLEAPADSADDDTGRLAWLFRENRWAFPLAALLVLISFFAGALWLGRTQGEVGIGRLEIPQPAQVTEAEDATTDAVPAIADPLGPIREALAAGDDRRAARLLAEMVRRAPDDDAAARLLEPLLVLDEPPAE